MRVSARAGEKRGAKLAGDEKEKAHGDVGREGWRGNESERALRRWWGGECAMLAPSERSMVEGKVSQSPVTTREEDARFARAFPRSRSSVYFVQSNRVIKSNGV